MLTVDLFSVYLFSRVDIAFRYIEVDFTFGLPEYVRYTVETRFNEPLFNEVLDITNDILGPSQSYSKMYGIEPRYNEPRYNEFLSKDQKCQFYFLQEIYFESNDERIWRSEWGGDIFISTDQLIVNVSVFSLTILLAYHRQSKISVNIEMVRSFPLT